MAAYPYMVQTAYNVLDDIFYLWQDEPYRWHSEADLQTEITGRLNQIFRLQGLGEINGDYKWVKKGHKRDHVWNRVCNQIYVGHRRGYYFPDIVIWDDKEEDETIKDYQLWPILWACELKYDAQKMDIKEDVKKLRTLLEEGRIQYGCSVNMHFKKGKSSATIKWKKEEQTGKSKGDRKLWRVDVYLPKLIKGSK